MTEPKAEKARRLPPLHGGYKPHPNGRKPLDNPPKAPGGRGAASPSILPGPHGG